MRYVNFEKLESKSGIKTYLMDLPYTNTVAVGLLVKAGTRDEIWPEEAGLAHALEHVVYQGTEKFPTSEKLSELLDDVGGYDEAWTDKESMFFYCRVPAKEKARAFISLGEIINRPLIPEEKVQTEMKNIIEELRMYKDQPYDYLNDQLALPAVYGDHPGSRQVIGTEKSLRSFKREDFLRFKDKFFHPANFTFIIAGNIDDEDVLELIEDNFPFVSKKTENERVPEIIKPNPRKIFTYKKELNQVHLMLAAEIPGARDSHTKSLEMFSSMLSGGWSSPLIQEIRNANGLCYEISSGIDKMTDAGMFYVYIGTDPTRYQQAIDLSLQIIEKSKNDKDLLEKAKKIITGKLVMNFENTEEIINLAAQDIVENGEPRNYKGLKGEIDSISIKDIEEAVNLYLSPDKLKQIILMPKPETTPQETKDSQK